MKESIHHPKLLFTVPGAIDFEESIELIFMPASFREFKEYTSGEICSDWLLAYEKRESTCHFDLMGIDIPNKCCPVFLRIYSHSHDYGKKCVFLHSFSDGLEIMLERGDSFTLAPQLSKLNHNYLREDIDIAAVPIIKVKPLEKSVVRGIPEIGSKRFPAHTDIINQINGHLSECKTPEDVMKLQQILESLTQTVRSCAEYMYGKMDSSEFKHNQIK